MVVVFIVLAITGSGCCCYCRRLFDDVTWNCTSSYLWQNMKSVMNVTDIATLYYFLQFYNSNTTTYDYDDQIDDGKECAELVFAFN